jgi:hypothetical protein
MARAFGFRAARLLFVAWICGGCAGTEQQPARTAEPRPAASSDASVTKQRPVRGADRAPHAMLEAIQAELGTNDDGTRSSSLPEEACRRFTAYAAAELESCSLDTLANGTAPLVAVVHDCGDHACDVEWFVWYGDQGEPYHLSSYGPTALEVSPDHRYLLIGAFDYAEPKDEEGTAGPPVATGFTTWRFDRKTGQKDSVAPCISAKLSPDGRYYACRDFQGNVLRFPADFGPTELIAKAAIPAGDAILLAGPFVDFPDAVEFIEPGTISYDVDLRSGQSIPATAPWPR